MQTLDVFLAGRVLPGADTRKAVAALAKMVGLEPDRARALLCSGRQRLARRGLSPEAAQALVDKFAALGIAAFAQAHGAGAPPAQSAPQAAAPAVRRPEPIQPDSGPETGAFNPYAAPRADLHSARRRDGDSRGIWRDIGRSVPAGHGIRWLKDAWRLVSRRLGMWLGAWLLWVLCWVLMAFLLNLLPSPIGSILNSVLQILLGPILAGGMMLLAHRQHEDQDCGALDVFAGFQSCPGHLALLGLLQLLYSFGVGMLAVITAVLAGSMLGKIAVIALLVIVIGLLMLPLSAAAVVAPTLVAVAGHSPWQALYQGCMAAFRNWRPILLNFLVIACIPLLSGIVALFTMSAGHRISAVIGVAFLAVTALYCLCLGIIAEAMIYTAVRDIFYEET